MKNIFRKFTDKFFGDAVDFRAQTFNLVMFIGLLNGIVVSSLLLVMARGESPSGIPGLAASVLTVALIWYANKSGNFKLCYWIITILSFMISAGFGFLINGGYKGGMILYFVAYVVVTAVIFKGKSGIIVPLMLIVHYSALCVYAHYNPEAVRTLGDREQFLFNTTALIMVCITLSAIMVLHLKNYDRQKRELEEARKAAVEYEKLKTDFFGKMSHEYRTPLSVISASAEIAGRHIEANKITANTHDYLLSIKHEAMRLAGITSITMASLRLPFESRGDEGEEVTVIQKRFTPVYINDLARIMSGIVKLAATQNEIALHVDTEDDMPPIRGDRETLITLMLNLLHNCVVHANCKNIMISAYKKDRHARLLIEDDGAGIPEKLYKTLFKRGVSGNGGAGNGLYVCDKIVFAHRGNISIENRRDGGTRVIITFPLPKE